MDERLQQRARIVGDRAREEQVVEHEQIALKGGPLPRFALGRWAQCVAVKEVTGLDVLHLLAVPDGLKCYCLRHVLLPVPVLPMISAFSPVATNFRVCSWGNRLAAAASFEQMAALAANWQLPFPYLYDETCTTRRSRSRARTARSARPS